MNKCCEIGNLKVATPDGTHETATVVCLQCKTCGFGDQFVYRQWHQFIRFISDVGHWLEDHHFNICFAFVEWAFERQRQFPETEVKA